MGLIEGITKLVINHGAQTRSYAISAKFKCQPIYAGGITWTQLWEDNRNSVDRRWQDMPVIGTGLTLRRTQPYPRLLMLSTFDGNLYIINNFQFNHIHRWSLRNELEDFLRCYYEPPIGDVDLASDIYKRYKHKRVPFGTSNVNETSTNFIDFLKRRS